MLTTIRASSLSGVMSPKPTVEKMVIGKVEGAGVVEWLAEMCVRALGERQVDGGEDHQEERNGDGEGMDGAEHRILGPRHPPQLPGQHQAQRPRCR